MSKEDKIKFFIMDKLDAIKTMKDMLGEEALNINPSIYILEKAYKEILDKIDEILKGDSNE